MSPNPAHDGDPTPLSTNVGEELNLSSLARLLGRIEQKCDSAIEGLKAQADQIRGLRVSYDDIRSGVVDASRMRSDLDGLKKWRDDREESGKSAAVAARTRIEVAAEQAAAADKSVFVRAKTKFVEGAFSWSGQTLMGIGLGWGGHLFVEYIKSKP